MIYLKIKRTNSIFGTWKCEEIGKHKFVDPIGIGSNIQEAIEIFLKEYKFFNGFTPDYKWS